ncbi:DNA topoisomerase I [Angomonas deanei]|nr:DNA topoisomerase I [Angomonas deanei]|eukprot:EPY23796.1 DNA topoisomerase I [Angomonas deanei]
MTKKEEEKKVKVESDDENGTQTQEWWEQEDLQIATKGEKRWDTLVHNGVMFPPDYVPHGIPILYKGEVFKMTPEEEEVATMFAVMKETDYYQNPVFRDNFFSSWREILDKRLANGGSHPIKELVFCDFSQIYNWHQAEREKKKSLTSEEKKKIKQENDALAEPYKTCLWDGREEQVANFRVEPPGLFRGRGKHPLAGKLKKRIYPEDIIINIGKDAPVPTPSIPGKWKEIRHDNTVTWLATWRDTILDSSKYVMLAPSSTIKGQSDMMKFEKARKLKGIIDNIRASYMKDFKSNDIHEAQRAVAMYFIDRLALRVGNEKSEDEADTVGCCSLRVEHLTLLPDSRVGFDFLGKDSIRYQNEVDVVPEVHALLARFMKGKRPENDVFDQLTTTQLNDHLKSFMEGLTAKVFRTYNASITLDKWFKEKPVDKNMTIPDKLAYFNEANTQVAILCNHQKSVSKNFKTQMFQLSAKSEYTNAIINDLEHAKASLKKGKSLQEVSKEFFESQDKQQLEWLEEYGTEEQRKEYKEIMEKRKNPSKSSRTSSKSKSKSSKASTKKKTPTKKIKVEEESDEDAPLGALVGKSPAKKDTKKKAAAKPAKKKAAAKKKSTPVKRARSASTKGSSTKKKKVESDDDEDVPLGSL